MRCLGKGVLDQQEARSLAPRVQAKLQEVMAQIQKVYGI
jgi:hypothetical protein